MTPKDQYILQRCEEIQSNLADAKTWSASDARLGAYLAGYITILISGVVEDCIEYLVSERARRGNDAELATFVSHLFGQHFRNPRSEGVANLLSMFSESYRDQYLAAVPTRSREALGSIIANRMSLAHTGAWRHQTTVIEVEEYFANIIPILVAVEDILL